MYVRVAIIIRGEREREIRERDQRERSERERERAPERKVCQSISIRCLLYVPYWSYGPRTGFLYSD